MITPDFSMCLNIMIQVQFHWEFRLQKIIKINLQTRMFSIKYTELKPIWGMSTIGFTKDICVKII